MLRRPLAALRTALLFSLVAAALLGGGSTRAQTRTTRPLAQGVELIQEVTPEGTEGGPLVVTVVRARPRAKGIRVEAALGQDRVWGSDPTQGREIVSTLTNRHKAVAGINAGFFPFAGNPIGLHVQDGEVVTEPASRRTVFLLTKSGRARFAALTYSGTVRGADGATFPLDGLNRKPGVGKGGELLLFTPVFFDATLRSPGRVEAVLEGVRGPLTANREYTGKVRQVTEGGGTPLAPGTVVLSGGGAGADFLRRAAQSGTKLTFRLDVATTDGKPYDLTDVRHAVAGGPRLLTDGRVTITLSEEGMGRSFSETRHPRTAVGVDKDGALLLVTVDGRQKGLSRGASLPELAQILLKFGAVDAVNLDGGGSSAVVARGAIINSPSDGRERAVANMLLVHANPLKPEKAPPLRAPSAALKVGETWDLSVAGKNQSNIVWGTSGSVGFVSQGGKFVALRSGSGTVTAVAGGGKPVSVPVVVVAPAKVPAAGAAEFTASLRLVPDPDRPERATLVIRLANPDGDPLGGEAVALAVSGGRAESPSVMTDARGETRAVILWDGAAAPDQAVSVSSPGRRFAPARVTRMPPAARPAS